MSMTVKPVFVLSRGAGVFVEPEGRLEIQADAESTRLQIGGLLKALKDQLGDRATFLEELLVGDPEGFAPLISSETRADVLLVYFLGVTPIERLLRWQGPIIAFGGQQTPAFALYAVGEERHHRDDLYVALDYEEIGRLLKVLEVKKALSETRVLLFGFPAAWHLRWYAFPDLELIRRKIGLQFIPVELQELMDNAAKVDQGEAASVADVWMEGAHRVMEPSKEDISRSAAVYLAMDEMLRRKGATAMAMNCLDITQSRKFQGRMTNPCLAMAQLRDRGIPSACEMDIAGLLSMLMLGLLSEKATFLGNIVRADPGENTVKISHCILPSRMPGLKEEPLPHVLRDFHGGPGVTAFTEVPQGTQITMARARRNLERMVASTGRVVGCEDTTFCRNTLTIQINDVRAFVRQTDGNHQVVVFGDYLDELRALGHVLGFDFCAV